MLARPSRFRDRHRTAWRAAVRALGAKGLLPRTGTPNGARGGCCGPGADSAQPRRSRHGYPLDCEQRLQQRHQPPSRCGPRNSGSARGARRAGRAGLCQAQAWASRRTNVRRGPGGRERARARKPIKTSAARHATNGGRGAPDRPAKARSARAACDAARHRPSWPCARLTNFLTGTPQHN